MSALITDYEKTPAGFAGVFFDHVFVLNRVFVLKIVD